MHLSIYLSIYLSIWISQRKVLKSLRNKMGITHMQLLPGYHQNGFLVNEALDHMMYVMHSDPLQYVWKPAGKVLLYVKMQGLF